MKRTAATLVLGLSTVFLVACGGGGGISSSTPAIPDASLTEAAVTPSDFSWATSTANTASVIGGIGQSVGYREDSDGNVTAISDSALGGASLSVTYNGNTAGATGISASIQAAGVTTDTYELDRRITSPFGGFTLSQLEARTGSTQTSNSNSSDSSSSDSSSSDQSSGSATIANPFSVGWNYQTFGLWNQRDSTSSLTGTAGTVSVGLGTQGASIPTTGNATYNGFAFGASIGSSGDVSDVVSAMTATANFADRAISFTTTNSHVLVNNASPRADSDFNLSGTLSYTPSTNEITGNVNSVGGLSGLVNGRFYGPAAQEIGGTFDLGNSADRFLGGFGGKR